MRMLKFKSLTLNSKVFTSLENPEDLYAKQTFPVSLKARWEGFILILCDSEEVW